MSISTGNGRGTYHHVMTLVIMYITVYTYKLRCIPNIWGVGTQRQQHTPDQQLLYSLNARAVGWEEGRAECFTVIDKLSFFIFSQLV